VRPKHIVYLAIERRQRGRVEHQLKLHVDEKSDTKNQIYLEIWTTNSEEKIPLGRCLCVQYDIMERGLKEIMLDYVDWLCVVQNRDQL
jgi:hypothetical protein